MLAPHRHTARLQNEPICCNWLSVLPNQNDQRQCIKKKAKGNTVWWRACLNHEFTLVRSLSRSCTMAAHVQPKKAQNKTQRKAELRRLKVVLNNRCHKKQSATTMTTVSWVYCAKLQVVLVKYLLSSSRRLFVRFSGMVRSMYRTT